jgi:type 1 glutamine amidotransferase
VLLLTGGSPHAHDYGAIGDALETVLAGRGHEVTRTAHPDDAADAARSETFDVLVVNGLWWTMRGDAYEPWREHAYSATPRTRQTFDDFVRGGGGLVALHTTPICFDDWPGWGDVVGGSWQWGVSSHPPAGAISARVVGGHPVVAGLAPTIELVDEVYGDLAVRDAVRPLAFARRSDDDREQPVVWAHHWGDGRVVFDGFGHDAASITHPDNSTIILQAVDWTARR